MSKASIVDKYLNRSVHNESLTDNISELANQLNMMSMKMHQNSEKQEMSKIYMEGKRHTKAKLPEKLESNALNSGFNQERNMGSNQLQIHNLLNTTNREPTPTRKEGRKNIYYQILWRYTKIRKKHQEG